MKIKTKHLLLRVITFPIKLLFTLIWFNLWSIKVSLQWLFFGGEELFYGKDRATLVDLIQQNEKIIKYFNQKIL